MSGLFQPCAHRSAGACGKSICVSSRDPADVAHFVDPVHVSRLIPVRESLPVFADIRNLPGNLACPAEICPDRIGRPAHCSPNVERWKDENEPAVKLAGALSFHQVKCAWKAMKE